MPLDYNFLTKPVGCVPSAVVAIRGVSAQGVSTILHAGICLPRGYLSQCMLGYTPSPVNRMTDACENITFRNYVADGKN